jgi:hypothetical protein
MARRDVEADMMTIRHPVVDTPEPSARSSHEGHEQWSRETELLRTKTALRFPRSALHGEGRRGGKTAKLLDLRARLNLSWL